jgi:hypothetical protein
MIIQLPLQSLKNDGYYLIPISFFTFDFRDAVIRYAEETSSIEDGLRS